MNNHILDDPNTTLQRSELIRKKVFLRAFYEDAYNFFRSSSSETQQGIRVEIGSGAGFIKNVLPDVITSEYLNVPTVDIPKCSALAMPFQAGTLSSLFLLDVLHHLPDLNIFFREALRVLMPGGVIAMVEPSNTLFSQLIYRYFHHEIFDPSVGDWKLPEKCGPVSTANSALPWIVFVRDRKQFDQCYPQLKVERLEPFSPLLYLLSGGVGRANQFIPGSWLPGVRMMEFLLRPLNRWMGLFYRIVLRRSC